MSWRDAFAEILESGVDLAALTSLRVGGRAAVLARPRSGAEVARLLVAFSGAGLPWRVLGGGTNLLVEDGVHAVPVIRLDALSDLSVAGAEAIVGAGVPLQTLVNATVREGMAGLEPVTGIPGTVGGAVAMNAGGRHGDIAGAVSWIRVALPDGSITRLSPDEIGFRYRGNDLPSGAVVLEAAFRVRSDDPAAVRARAAAIQKAKAATQPVKTWNAGCVFRNPEGGSAGRLIDEAGLKGLRRGGAVVSDVHANFIVNEGRATAADVLGLIAEVRRRVAEASGVELRCEIRIWNTDGSGCCDPQDDGASGGNSTRFRDVSFGAPAPRDYNRATSSGEG